MRPPGAPARQHRCAASRQTRGTKALLGESSRRFVELRTRDPCTPRPRQRPFRRGSRADRDGARAGTSALTGRACDFASFDPLRQQAAKARCPHQLFQPSRLRTCNAHACTRNAVVVSAFIACIRCRPASRGLYQPGLHHACQRAVHRPDVRDRRFAARFDVPNDSVAMPFAGSETEKYVKLDPPQWQALVYSAVTIYSHELPRQLNMPYSMCGAYSICATHVSLSRATGRFQLAFRSEFSIELIKYVPLGSGLDTGFSSVKRE